MDKRRARIGETITFIDKVVFPYQGQECLIWPFGRNSAGYGHVGRNGRNILVHRMACEDKNGPPPSSGHHAMHTCGNGHLGCCNPNHLVWGTASENSQDRRNHGTFKVGEDCPAAFLTREDVIEIREAVGTHTEISERFNVSRSNVSLIRSGKSWKHLQ